MKQYVKLISAILGGVSSWGLTAALDDNITAVEYFGLLGVLGTAFAVWAFPNDDAPEGD